MEKRDLDRMTEADKRADMLSQLAKHGALRITSRQALGFWQHAMEALRDEGLITVKMKEVDEQESYLLIEPAGHDNELDT